MNRTTVQVQGAQKEALVSHEHKMLLIPSEKQQMVTGLILEQLGFTPGTFVAIRPRRSSGGQRRW